MIIKFKNIFFLSMSAAVILLIVFNWNFLLNIYHYNIYKENCIISSTNNYKINQKEVIRDKAIKFCNCKIKNFKKEQIKIFVSKLRVQKKFLEKEKIINEICKKNL